MKAAGVRAPARTHRHTLGHEHEFEPAYGLPELLPENERVLWQGSPDWLALAHRAFHLRKLVVYFAAMLGLRAAVVLNDGGTVGSALASLAWLAPAAALALAGIATMAWLSARGAVYTITDRRVVMRIGIVLTVTFNLPYKRIEGAGLQLDAAGTGDVTLALKEGDRIAWMHLWPHARPWRLRRPEPMLRCLTDGAAVARLLTQAWAEETGQTDQAGPTAQKPAVAPTRAEPKRPLRVFQPMTAGD